MHEQESKRLELIYTSLKREIRDRSLALPNMPHILARSVRCCIQLGYQCGWLTSFRMACRGLQDLSSFFFKNTRLLMPLRYPYARLRLAFGLEPLSHFWGLERGLPIHRYYLQQFLYEYTSDVQGHCLEFQDDFYTLLIGRERVEKVDILHIDDTNHRSTLVADLTKHNNIPSDTFDCIICTHVLNVIFDLHTMLEELYRILKPGGILLVGVPHIHMYHPSHHGIWRFTPEGLFMILSKGFGKENVILRSYGNSLTAAADIRGVVAQDLPKRLLDYHDPYYPVEVCARAIKL